MSGNAPIVHAPSAPTTNTPEKRLGPLFPQDLGEQVVGSDHKFPVPGLVNIAEKPAEVRASVEGDPVLSVPQLPVLTAPMQSFELDLRYAPTSAGTHQGRLTVQAEWSDGHQETATTAVVARARGLEDAPLGADRGAASNSPALKPAIDPRAPALQVMNVGMAKMRSAIGGLIMEQKDGVTVVQNEQQNFKAAPVEPSLWADLIELAIAIGTDGVGAIVEHFVEKAVAGVAKKVVQHEAHHVSDAIAHAAHHEEEALSSKAIAAAVGGGVKHIVEHKLKGESEGASEHETAADGEHEKPRSHAYSANPTVDFFARQQHLLNAASIEAKDHAAELEASLAPLAYRDPDGAAATLEAITGAIKLAFDGALTEQAQATAAEFAAFKARLSLGGESVNLGLKSRTATKMEEARHYDKMTAPKAPHGLLEIRTELRGGDVHVISARVDGIAQATADRLLSIDLAARGVPLRIVLGDSYGVITRDELGRVRYSGYLPLDRDSRVGMDEVQQMRGAERIANQVLARTLGDWGLQSIATNDVGKDSE